MMNWNRGPGPQSGTSQLPSTSRYSWSALASAGATAVVVLLAYLWTPAVRVPVGEQDSLVYHNFNEVETLDNFTFRWSTGRSSLTLPQLGQPASGSLKLGLWIPDTHPAVPLTLIHDDRPLLTVPVQPGFRTVFVLAPREVFAPGDVRLDLVAPPWHSADDPRILGVAVTEIGWSGLGRTLPPARQLAVLPALAAAITLLFGRLRYRSWNALLAGALSGAGLAIWSGLAPLAVAPYTTRLLLLIVLAHITLILWTALAQRNTSGWHLPVEADALQLVTLFALSYWLYLPFQWALCREVGSGVCPRPGTHVIGLVLLPAILVLIAWPRMQPAVRHHWGLRVLAFAAVAAGIYATMFAFRRSAPDFFIHWRAAFEVHLGRPLYKLDEIRANHFGHAYKLPPFYMIFFLPYATADDMRVLVGFRVINVTLLLASAGLLANMLRSALGWKTALAAVAVVVGLMQPAFDTIAIGQTDIFLLVLLVLMLIGLRSRRSWLVGLPLALAISFKIYPLLLMGLLVIRREWRSLLWTMLGLILFNGLAVAVVGWRPHLIWLTEVLPSLGGGSSWVENQTLNGFLSRLIMDSMRLEPIRDPLLDLLTYGSFVLVAGISFLLVLPRTDRDKPGFMLQYSLLPLVLVLAVPAAWIHYSTITILPFVALVWHAAVQKLSLRQACAAALAFGLIAYGNQWSFFTGTRHPGLPALALSYKTLGLTLLWCVLVRTLWLQLKAELIRLFQRATSHPRPARPSRAQ